MAPNFHRHTSDTHTGEAVWEAVHHSIGRLAEALERDRGGVVTIGNGVKVSKVEAIVGVTAHFGAAMQSAIKGDWEATAHHANSMSNAALNDLSGGVVGAVEAAIDAAAAMHRAQGHEAPTSEEISHWLTDSLGGAIGDLAWFTFHPGKETVGSSGVNGVPPEPVDANAPDWTAPADGGVNGYSTPDTQPDGPAPDFHGAAAGDSHSAGPMSVDSTTPVYPADPMSVDSTVPVDPADLMSVDWTVPVDPADLMSVDPNMPIGPADLSVDPNMPIGPTDATPGFGFTDAASFDPATTMPFDPAHDPGGAMSLDAAHDAGSATSYDPAHDPTSYDPAHNLTSTTSYDPAHDATGTTGPDSGFDQSAPGVDGAADAPSPGF
jgi:hypothetical protein